MMRLSDNSKAAFLMCLTMLSYATSDVFMKSLLAAAPMGQLIVLRGLIALPFILVLMAIFGQLRGKMSAQDWKFCLWRAAAEISATLFFFSALKSVPLTNASAMLQVIPLTVTLAAALFLKEKVGWRRWIAILIGCSGVLLVLQPGLSGWTPSALLVLGTVVSVTIRDLTTRQLSASAPSLFITGVTSLALMMMGAALIPAGGWIDLPPYGWWYLIMTGIAISAATLLSVMVMRVGDVSFASPFRYSAMVFAFIYGFFIFGERPNILMIIGIIMIIGGGLFTLIRERQIKSKSA